MKCLQQREVNECNFSQSQCIVLFTDALAGNASVRQPPVFNVLIRPQCARGRPAEQGGCTK